MNEAAARDHLRKVLDWGDAHATFDAAVANVPEWARGERPPQFPHSLWELLEHVRLAQADILDFCRNPEYVEMEWPAEYWPKSPAPPSAEAWDESIRHVQEDRAVLQVLALDGDLDLTALIPHGSGQTYLRELLLVADHTSYHVGQMIAVRRLLGVWNPA